MGSCTSTIQLDQGVLGGTMDCPAVRRKWPRYGCSNKLVVDALDIKGDIDPNKDLEFYYYYYPEEQVLKRGDGSTTSSSSSSSKFSTGDSSSSRSGTPSTTLDRTEAAEGSVGCAFELAKEYGSPTYVHEWVVYNNSQCVTRNGETMGTMGYLHVRFSSVFLMRYPWMAFLPTEAPPMTNNTTTTPSNIHFANHTMEWYVDVHHGCPVPDDESDSWGSLSDLLGLVVILLFIILAAVLGTTAYGIYRNCIFSPNKKKQRNSFDGITTNEAVEGEDEEGGHNSGDDDAQRAASERSIIAAIITSANAGRGLDGETRTEVSDVYKKTNENGEEEGGGGITCEMRSVI